MARANMMAMAPRKDTTVHKYQPFIVVMAVSPVVTDCRALLRRG